MIFSGVTEKTGGTFKRLNVCKRWSMICSLLSTNYTANLNSLYRHTLLEALNSPLSCVRPCWYNDNKMITNKTGFAVMIDRPAATYAVLTEDTVVVF